MMTDPHPERRIDAKMALLHCSGYGSIYGIWLGDPGPHCAYTPLARDAERRGRALLAGLARESWSTVCRTLARRSGLDRFVWQRVPRDADVDALLQQAVYAPVSERRPRPLPAA